MEEDFWKNKWETTDRELAKARFMHGWLVGCLQGAGLSAKEAGEHYKQALAEANRIYGE